MAKSWSSGSLPGHRSSYHARNYQPHDLFESCGDPRALFWLETSVEYDIYRPFVTDAIDRRAQT